LQNNEELIYYDLIISNPPYYKLNINSLQAIDMKRQKYGYTKAYSLFMSIAIKMLQNGGEMVFITPRSFCSGFYHNKFRKWLTSLVSINYIHLFESRKDLFAKDGVLQENIIFRAHKTKSNSKIKITFSNGKEIGSPSNIEVKPEHVMHNNKDGVVIRIPISNSDIKIIEKIDKWPCTFKNFGLDVSTGQVVPFRTKKHLSNCRNSSTEAPLLWMHNLQNFNVKWPINKKNKEKCIMINSESKKILFPVQNCILLKRFSSKEQKRRINCSVLKKSIFKEFKYVGIENHLNSIYRVDGELTEEEAYGIAAILNCSIMDRYFRCLNGHTQVNATDIKNLKLPDIEMIRRIGQITQRKDSIDSYELDVLLSKFL
jgi:adenine-specific DNA-methyltransferase